MTAMQQDDPYTTEPTHLRIFSQGVEWFVDGVDNERNYTEACWSFDTFADALTGAKEFVEEYAEDYGITWKWRAQRPAQQVPSDLIIRPGDSNEVCTAKLMLQVVFHYYKAQEDDHLGTAAFALVEKCLKQGVVTANEVLSARE